MAGLSVAGAGGSASTSVQIRTDLIPIVTATFDAQQGTAALPPTSTVTNGQSYGALATTSRTGFVFGGWWTGANGTGYLVTPGTIVTATTDHTLYARWVPVMTVTFDAQQGMAAVPPTTTVTNGMAYGPLATTSRAGFVFGGWWTDSGETGSPVTLGTTVTATSDHTLYARWLPVMTVSFNAQQGTAAVPPSTTVTNGLMYGALATTTRAGYTFMGWYTDITNTGMLVTADTVVTATSNHTLYATWAELGSSYLVVDVSGGPGATNYPCSYLGDVPPGGWTDVYKTDRLVLKKIPAGTFTMGSPTNEIGCVTNETQHKVTLSRGYYIGIFEVTQRQWENVMGNLPSYFCNSTVYACRPVEQVSSYDIRESSDNSAINPNWPQSEQVFGASFMGRLRAKTGLLAFDLPTEAQWEYACRAGSPAALNSGYNLTNAMSDAHMAEVGRHDYLDNSGGAFTQNSDTNMGTATVGSYLPNAWGLFDMHGNAFEWCLDWYDAYPGAVQDPLGAVSGSSRAVRGGGWAHDAWYSRSAFRGYDTPSDRSLFIGFRAARTLPANQYSLTVVGGTGSGEFAAGTVVAVVAEPPSGQVFVRWTVSVADADLGANFSVSQATTSVTSPARDITLTAVFANIIVCSVTFQPVGGTVSPTSATVTNGLPYGNLPIPVKTGYDFKEWYTNDTYLGSQVTAATVVTATSAHTLYAKWTVAGTPGVTVLQSGGSTAVSESGGTDTYTLSLNALPSADVTITINTGSQLTASPTSRTFYVGTWSVTQTVTVAAVDDAVCEGTHQATITNRVTSGDASYNNIVVSNVVVTITDNDPQSLVLSTNALLIAEGLSTNFAVRLAAQPTSSVVVSTGWYNGDTDLKVITGSNLTFMTSTWSNPQTVTLAAAEDPDLTNGVARFVSSAFGCSSITVTVTEADDDFILNLFTNGNGTVSGGGIKDRDNSPFVIGAVPGVASYFRFWSGPDAGKVSNTNSASTSIAATTAASVTANFGTFVICTVTFVPVGGTVSPTSATVTNGLPYGSLPVPFKNGYDFKGWYTSVDYSGEKVTAATVVTATAAHSLYAKWEETQKWTVWSGGSTANSFWNNSSNWDSHIPVVGDELIFGGTDRLVNTNNLAIGTSFSGITFTNGAGAFSLRGNAISLGGPIVNLDDDLQTLALPVTVSAVQTVNASNGAVAVGGVVSGAGGLLKAGPRGLTLSGNNTYLGLTVVTNGNLLVRHGNALGSTNGLTSVANNGWVEVEGAVSVPETLLLEGDNASGMLRSSAGTNVWSGMVTQSAPSRVSVETGRLTLSGGIAGSTKVNLVAAGGAELVLTSNPVKLGTSGTVSASGAGTVTLGATNCTFGTLEVAGPTVRMVSAGVLPSTAILAIGTAASPDGTFDLNGFNQTVSQLKRGIPTGGSRRVTSAAPATLTVNQSSSSTYYYDGQLEGALGLTKSGVGILQLLGANNTCGGAITVEGGTLSVSATSGLGCSTNITVAGGTLELKTAAGIVSDGAVLSVSSGAVVKLGSGVNETVGRLYLGGVLQAAGTWGATGSGAANLNDTYFTGSGMITVSEGTPPGVTVTLPSLSVTEGGAVGTYTVALNTQPTTNVTINVNAGPQLTAVPATLNFMRANWHNAQTVTVSAVNDLDIEGPHTGTVTHSVISSDSAYDGIAVSNVLVNITDNDPQSVLVTFESQGGTTPSPQSKMVTYGSAYGALATTTRSGYTFGGWYTNAACSSALVTIATTVLIPADHQLYAKWNLPATINTPVPVPYSWLDKYTTLMSIAGGNYEIAAMVDLDLDGMITWEEYVAGTDPTNKASVFLSTLLVTNGQFRLLWVPDLTGAVPERVYSIYGTPLLLNGFSTTPLTNISAGMPVPVKSFTTNRFFKVGVGLQ